MEIWIVSGVLVATLALLLTEKLPVDLVAIGIMVALMVTGILTPLEAVSGFANPAVITVGAMFVISRAMMRTGAVGFIGQRLISSAGGSTRRVMLLVLAIVAVASAFINNTPVVVLFIPVILSLSCEYGFSPSKFLIPLSYASILAGTCTLIGTSTNIIVSDLSAKSGYGALGMFELSILGVPVAVLGLVFIFLAAPALMPAGPAPVCETRDGSRRRYLAELAVPTGSELTGQDPRVLARRYGSLEVIELIRYSHVFYPDREPVSVATDDLLLVKASANDLVEILAGANLKLPPSEEGLKFEGGRDDALLAELIIPPQSSLVGERLLSSALKRHPDIHIIAIQRSSLHYTEQKIQDVRLRTGDILLVRCPPDKLDRVRAENDVIIAEDVHHQIVHKQKAGRAAVIFAAMVAAATAGVADIMVCALTALFLMVVSGCLQLRDAYRALQGDVLLLIAGTIALGAAMENTGASQAYAQVFLGFFEGMPPAVILSAFLLLTSVSTQVLSNNATAVLLLPIAISTATALGVHPKPFIVAVCFGASACFATPIGYQTNLLVYGPGSYQFKDYLKLGLPLNLLVLVMGALFIPVFWPF